jgi:hypothetical protein
MAERPAVAYSDDAIQYEEDFSRLLEQFPCPDKYLDKDSSKSPIPPGQDIRRL